MRYPKGKEIITGYNYEPWHYRYVGVKIAATIQQTNLTYDEFYARYIEKVFLQYPEASNLSGDEFYDMYLSKLFTNGQVFVEKGSIDEELTHDINVLLGAMNPLASNEYIEEDKEETLVLSSAK